MSKYIDFGLMSIPEFAKSNVGTIAKFVLTLNPKSRTEVSKSIKSACTKYGSKCEIKTVDIMIKTDDVNWVQTHILEATITEMKK